jgi:hypothetical protein
MRRLLVGMCEWDGVGMDVVDLGIGGSNTFEMNSLCCLLQEDI